MVIGDRVAVTGRALAEFGDVVEFERGLAVTADVVEFTGRVLAGIAADVVVVTGGVLVESLTASNPSTIELSLCRSLCVNTFPSGVR